MPDEITTFSGSPMQPSPGIDEAGFDPGEEITSHLFLDMLGLGGLSMVMFAMKFQGELHALNSNPANTVNYRPTAFTPDRSMKPC